MRANESRKLKSFCKHCGCDLYKPCSNIEMRPSFQPVLFVVASFGSNFIAFHDSGFRSIRAVVAAML